MSSSFAPWDESEAEKAARDFGTRYEYTGEQVWTREGFRAGIKWAAERIEKCPTIHGGENNMGTLSWSPSKMNGDTHIAKLVGVKEIEL